MPMAPIQSGTTTERIVRMGLMTVLLVVFAVLFVRDGFGGYARENRKDFVEKLGLEADAPPVPKPDLTRERAREILTSVKKGYPVSKLEEQLGEVTATKDKHNYYLGQGGWVWLQVYAGGVEEIGWDDAPHSMTDILWQKCIGLVLAVLSLVMLVKYAAVLGTRASLTDEGLKLPRHPLIPFDSMQALHTHDYERKGWVDLEYELPDGRASQARIDDYIIREFKPIVAEICKRRGFQNPLKPSATAADADEPADSPPSAGTGEPEGPSDDEQ